MGDQPPENLEIVPPHMFVDPVYGTRGFEFGFRWNYEKPKEDEQPPPQQQPAHQGCCCGGGGGGHQQMMMQRHHHHHGGYGGPRMMMPPPMPPRQLGPFNPHAMMAGQRWHHQSPGRFMGGAPPYMRMHSHRGYGGVGPHHHQQHAGNYNYYGGYEYEYDYPAYGPQAAYPGGFHY